MTWYHNTTTDRFESYARARGLTLAIARTPDNAAGAWHAIERDGWPLRAWIALGWTRAEVEQRIDEMAALGEVEV